jgi:hypothetical protein
MTALHSLLDHLDAMADAVLATPDDVYRARIEPAVSGTVGEHVRHALDHVGAILSNDGVDPLTYDRRERGTAVEIDPAAALRHIWRLRNGLERLRHRSMDEPIAVRSQMTAAGAAAITWSTVGRELAFIVSHTIHHQALIALLLAWQGVDVAPRFGVAPSTPKAS